jgi:hypothetical protein
LFIKAFFVCFFTAFPQNVQKFVQNPKQ